MKTSLSNNLSELGKTIQEYVQLRLDLTKLTALEKMTRISVFLISLLVMILLVSLFFIFFAAAFVVWYGDKFQDYLTGLFIVSSVVVVLGLLFYIFRRALVTTPIIKNLSEILFEDEFNTENEE